MVNEYELVHQTQIDSTTRQSHETIEIEAEAVIQIESLALHVQPCEVADVEIENAVEEHFYPIFTWIFSLILAFVFLSGAINDFDQQLSLSSTSPPPEMEWAFMRNIGSYPSCEDTRDELYRLVSSVFIHGGVLHFTCNVIAFLIFGQIYEEFGISNLALLVPLAAIVSNIFQMLANPWVPIVGASGINYALMGGSVSRCLASHLNIESGGPMSSPQRRLVTLFVLLHIAFDLHAYMYTQNANAVTGVAYASHTSGFILGLCMDFFVLQKPSLSSALCTWIAVTALVIYWVEKPYPPPVKDWNDVRTGAIPWRLITCCELKFLAMQNPNAYFSAFSCINVDKSIY